MDVSRYMYVMSSESVAMEPTSTFKRELQLMTTTKSACDEPPHRQHH
jgi:hypothetical protein